MHQIGLFLYNLLIWMGYASASRMIHANVYAKLDGWLNRRLGWPRLGQRLHRFSGLRGDMNPQVTPLGQGYVCSLAQSMNDNNVIVKVFE